MCVSAKTSCLYTKGKREILGWEEESGKKERVTVWGIRRSRRGAALFTWLSCLGRRQDYNASQLLAPYEPLHNSSPQLLCRQIIYSVGRCKSLSYIQFYRL